MQMGRGRRSPVLLLDPKDRSCQVPSADPASRRDFERAIAQLREVSPQAFRLATYLAPSNFTIPVARLIQEAKFGAATDPSHLGELFLSGLVFARAQSEDSPIVNRYFGFWPEAREILVRSLRQEDARWVVSELERQVSKYIEKVAGRSITFKGLVRRADGTYDLPEWATPFAQVANSLLGLSRADGELARAVDAFLHSAPLRSSRRDVLAILANLAEGGAFDESQIDRDILKELIGAHLIEHQGEQSWRFVEGVQGLLSKALLERSASGAVVRSGAPLMSQDGRVLGVRTGPSNLVRIYRHGFGECEFLSLDVPGGPPYNILVNCGLISGTPNAGAILTEVVDDVVRRSAGKLDILIVTQALRTKLSGFDVAEGWDRLEVDQLLLGWWEDPSDNLARELKYQDPAGTSRAAISSVKRKAKRSRFLNPTDEPYPLGETGARLFVLGVQRDLQYVQRFSWGPDQALDFAIELATGDVLLFVACNNSKIWRIWSEMSWIARDREVAGTDLLSRVVFCRTRLLGDDAQNLIQRAIPLMPSLRFVSAPSDRPLIAKRRWTLSAVGELTALLHSRGGAVLLSDVDPGYLPSDLLASHLYFDISLASRGGQSMRADRGRTRTKKKVSSKTIRRKK